MTQLPKYRLRESCHKLIVPVAGRFTLSVPSRAYLPCIRHTHTHTHNAFISCRNGLFVSTRAASFVSLAQSITFSGRPFRISPLSAVASCGAAETLAGIRIPRHPFTWGVYSASPTRCPASRAYFTSRDRHAEYCRPLLTIPDARLR